MGEESSARPGTKLLSVKIGAAVALVLAVDCEILRALSLHVCVTFSGKSLFFCIRVHELALVCVVVILLWCLAEFFTSSVFLLYGWPYNGLDRSVLYRTGP